MMIGWYPDWQTAVAWLVVTAIAAVIYFGPVMRLVDFGNYRCELSVQRCRVRLVRIRGRGPTSTAKHKRTLQPARLLTLAPSTTRSCSDAGERASLSI